MNNNGFVKLCYERRYVLVGFTVIFLWNCLASSLTDMAKGYDNLYYWHLFDPVFSGGGFSSVEVWRGYVFPIFCGILKYSAGGGYKHFVVANSLLTAFMFMIVIPSLHLKQKTFSVKESVVSVLNYFCVFLLFRGLFIHTLSDIFGLYMCVLGVFLIMRFKEESICWKLLAESFFIGLLLYFAYNVRTIYLFSGLASIAIFCVFIARKKYPLLKKVFFVLFLLIGIFIAASPQAFMNYKHSKKNGMSNPRISFFVPTQSLMFGQCAWGIPYQRYDTYIGMSDAGEQTDPGMFFIDPVGQKLLQAEGIELMPDGRYYRFDSGKQFVKFCLKYPLEVAGIYTRHFVNVLLPCWPNQYVERIQNNKVIYVLMTLSLLFVFCCAAVFGCYRNARSLVPYIPALVTCLFILPGAVESRFFLPVFLMLSGMSCFDVDYKKLIHKIRSHYLAVAIVFVCASALLISQWTSFLMSETEILIFMLGK